MAYIQFLGAAGVVTGSKHLINTSSNGSGKDGFQVLIDCGLFQGQKEWRERNWQDLPIPARDIDAVILTHAHLDHSGWIPRLVKEGFQGPIYATPATIDLCSILLPDSGHLQEEDAAFHNKRKSSKHSPALPLYTSQEAQDCMKLFRPVDFGQAATVAARTSRSASCARRTLWDRPWWRSRWVTARRLLFTGDIGRVRDSQIAPGRVVHSGPHGGRERRPAGDGIHLRQPAASHDRSPPGTGAAGARDGQARRLRDRARVRRRAHAEVPVHAEGADGVRPDPARAGARRQPHGHSGGQHFPEAHGGVQRRNQAADRAVRLAADLGRISFRHHAGGIEEDQRQPLPDDHRLLQRHGHRRTHPAPPDAAPARPAEPGAVHRIPVAGNARLQHQERRPRK